MNGGSIGPLLAADEGFTHQIVDTFATVSQSDPSWTEKIWTIAHARDNSLQVVLGVGKKWPTLDTVPLATWPGMSTRVSIQDIGFSSDGARLWCNQHDVGTTARVSILDWPARTVLHAVDLPGRSWPRFVASDGHRLFVAQHGTVDQQLSHELLSFDVA